MQPTPTRSPTAYRVGVGADLGDDSGDFVAGDKGVGRRAPVAAGVEDVGVTDPGVLDLDEDVVTAPARMWPSWRVRVPRYQSEVGSVHGPDVDVVAHPLQTRDAAGEIVPDRGSGTAPDPPR
jgi:hypothetical protein